MRAVDIIAAKRDGQELDASQIDFFVQGLGGLGTGKIPDYQASALLMAGFLQGFSHAEATSLTRSMTRSGAVLEWPGLPRTSVVDKHSTGGVGDKTSLIVAPICAALGLHVPMISGRGLGHTGGTLDKLEAIPGMNVRLSLDDFDRLVRTHGLCFMGQTKDIAPADGRLYALRDATATVPHRALIASSILSKKCAEGIGGLVMDVKTGSGAFMQSEDDAKALAHDLLSIGKGMGLDMRVLVTSMDTPLGTCAGNALETAECLRILHNISEDDAGLNADLRTLCLELAAHMLVLAKRFEDVETARTKAAQVVENGEALQKFRDVVVAQGGDAAVVDNPGLLPRARLAHHVCAEKDGFVSRADALLCGKACVLLGTGRNRAEDDVDHAVGLVLRAKPGTAVKSGDTLVEVHANDQNRLDAALPLVEQAFSIADSLPEFPPLLREIL